MGKRKALNPSIKGTAFISTLAAMTILAISTYLTNKAFEVVIMKMKKVNNEASKAFTESSFNNSEKRAIIHEMK